MQYTQDDLEPLKQALLSGTMSVTANGRTVTFQSPDQLRKTIRDIEESIKAQTPDTYSIVPNRVRATFTK